MPSSSTHACASFLAAFSSLAPQDRLQAFNKALAACQSDKAAETHNTLEELVFRVVMMLAEESASGNGSLNGAVVMATSDSGALCCVGMSGTHEQVSPLARHAAPGAIGDAAQHQGYSDLSGQILYTFAPCCPMCDAIVLGCGIRQQNCVLSIDQITCSVAGGVSAADLCSLPAERMMTYIAEDARDELLEKLQGHGAVLLDAAGRVLAFGDARTHNNPLALASFEAVRGALELGRNVWLPEGCTLVSYHRPHIFGVLLADQARLLRSRSRSNPLQPDQDSPVPDPMRICYLNDASEEMVLRDAQGQDVIIADAEEIRQQLILPAHKRDVQVTCATSGALQPLVQALRARWQDQSDTGARAGQ